MNSDCYQLKQNASGREVKVVEYNDFDYFVEHEDEKNKTVCLVPFPDEFDGERIHNLPIEKLTKLNGKLQKQRTIKFGA